MLEHEAADSYNPNVKLNPQLNICLIFRCPTWKGSLSLLGLSLISSMGVLLIITSVISPTGTNTGLQGGKMQND